MVLSPKSQRALLAKAWFASLSIEKKPNAPVELVIDKKWKVELELEAFEKSGIEGKKKEESKVEQIKEPSLP